MTLKHILDETYEKLHENNLVKTQYEFSRKWLKRSDGYYGYLKSTGADTTGDVALALWAECRKHKLIWDKAKKQNDNELTQAIFKGLAETTDKIERKVGDEVMKAYLAG